MGTEKGTRDLESTVDVDVAEVGRMEEIKRNLKSRHINMIAIAGMIVRPALQVSSIRCVLTVHRAPVSFSIPARFSQQRAQQVR